MHKALSNSNPLNSNISGYYKFNLSKSELTPIAVTYNSKQKQVYSIRLGSAKNNLFINHKDYSVIQTTYSINQMGMYEFTYNNSTYIFELMENQTKILIEKMD